MGFIAESLFPLRTKMAAARTSGWECGIQTASERASEVGFVLRHPMHDLALGLLDLRTQRVLSCDPAQVVPFAKAKSKARGLVDEGRKSDAGFVLFEGFETSQDRVEWVAGLAKLCSAMMPSCAPLKEIEAICADPTRWSEAHGTFSRIRTVLLEHDKTRRPRDAIFETTEGWTLSIAELCAKVVFNESMSPMTFDRDSGWALLPCVLSLADLSSPEDRARWGDALLG